MENGCNDPDVGLEARCHVDRVCDQFEEAWRADETPRIEAYLERVPPEGCQLATAELIALELALRHDAGEPVAPDEYYRRFPTHAAAVEAAFAAVAPIHPRKRLAIAGLPRPSNDRTTDTELGCPAAIDGPDRFVIRRRLGAGGMGVVYLAYDRKREEWVALKTIRRTEATTIYRMKREFRSLADVVHPNLVRLHELFFERDRWFFTMEYVEGVDFLRYLRCGTHEPPAQPDRCGAAPTSIGRREHPTENADEGTTRTGRAHADGTELHRAPNTENETGVFLRWTPEQVHRLRNALGQLVDGVSAIHQCGKLHRDIKPSNALVASAGRVVLLDFGLITEGGREAWDATTGQHIVGTAAYMSPEQAAGARLTEASDWYSVGVVLFEALTGQRPFVGSPTEVLIGKQSREAPAPKSLAAGIPDDLAALCVDLLHTDPAKRPSSPEILRRLAREDAVATSEQASSGPNISSNVREMPFVGRAAQLEALHDAVATVEAGGTVVVDVRGPSGAGKSALVEHFLGRVRHRPDTVILPGRCYERESVPYKALDSPIDALSHYLACLPRHEADALMPREVGALVQVFPVLERVEAVAGAPHRETAIPDRQELRQKAFDSLRELLARLGDRRLLVLWIDDLQWGDLDSLAAWSQLLRPPTPPALLLVNCYRSEYAATSPVLRAMLAEDSEMRRLGDVRQVEVGDLSFEEARNLAAELIHESSPAAEQLSNTIALESGGNPYFVDRLVRHYQVESRGTESGNSATDLSLDGVLWGYIKGIPASARRLLEVVAAAGYPLSVAAACRAAELEGRGAGEVEVLCAWNLLRTTTGADEQEQVETFHDRVRQTVVTHMTPAVLDGCHARLADVLEASGRADPATLASHFIQAGNPSKASTWYAQAAAQAADALAFDRAVELYRRVLELGVDDSGEHRQVRRHLADALANAGRGGEAGREYLVLAEDTTGGEAVELRRRAATQFLISGHVKEGMEALREVLEAVGLKLPEGRVATLVPLLLRRTRLRLRGLRFRRRSEEEIPPEALRQIDACWSAGMGLSLVEPFRAAYFLSQGLLLSLGWGELHRVARSLAVEAAHVAAAGGFAKRRAERLFHRAKVLAENQRSEYLEGLILLAEGGAACLWGQWSKSVELCSKSLDILRTRCEGVCWEVDTANSWILYSLACAGQLNALTQRLTDTLREATQRGNHYVVAHMATLVLPQLAANDPDGAERQLQHRPGQWPYGGFHVQHFDELHAQLEVDLYRGEGLAAWNRVTQRWPELAKSLLLRAQCARGHIYYTRARCALAAAETGNPTPFWKSAARDARRLRRERQPWIEPLADLIDAGLTAIQGAESEAERLLRTSIHGFDAADMPLHANAARRRLGELLGGEQGRRLVEEANAWMTAQGICDPARMARLFAPFRTN